MINTNDSSASEVSDIQNSSCPTFIVQSVAITSAAIAGTVGQGVAGNAIFQAAETALQTGLTAGEMASAMAGGGAAVMIPLTFARTIAMRYGYYPNRVAV